MSKEDDELPLEILVSDDPELRGRIGRYLGGIRKQREISQEAAAKGIGVSRPHLSNIELGRARTGWAGLKAMARYYQLEIEQLIAECELPQWQQWQAQQFVPQPAVKSETQGGARDNNNNGNPPESLATSPLEAWLVRSIRLLPKRDRKEIQQQIIERVLRHLRQLD